MGLSPYAKFHRFKRSEDLGNKACSYTDAAREQVKSKAAFTLLAEAFDEVVTGFFDMLDIPYSNDWLLSERIRQLSNHIELPKTVTNLPYAEYDGIIGENLTKARWLKFRNIHIDMISLAAGFREDCNNQHTGGGKLITTLLHLFQRFSDREIEHALDTPSAVSSLAPLYYWSEGERERVRHILHKRANVHARKRESIF